MFQEAVIENKKFKVSFVNTVRGFCVALKPPARGAVFVFLKSIWNGYYKIQFYWKVKMYEVQLPVDNKIPLRSETLNDYYSFIPAWLSLFSLLYREFGRQVLPDIRTFILDMSNLYIQSGKVFTEAQTTCKRIGKGGLFLSLLRVVDQEKNLAPSLHVEFAAFTYIRGVRLLRQYGNEKNSEEVKQELFYRAIRIIESTLLIKQHCVRDVALGLFMVTALDPEFTKECAEEMIGHIFLMETYGMSEALVQEIRETVKDVYYQALGGYVGSDPATTIIRYIKNI